VSHDKVILGLVGVRLVLEEEVVYIKVLHPPTSTLILAKKIF
jgi:hypothetical protein